MEGEPGDVSEDTEYWMKDTAEGKGSRRMGEYLRESKRWGYGWVAYCSEVNYMIGTGVLSTHPNMKQAIKYQQRNNCQVSVNSVCFL